MFSRFLLVLKMSVLDMIRETASFLGVSSVFGERKKRLRAIVSRGGPWMNELMNELLNEWKSEEWCMREQQTCPPTIYFNMWIISSDVSTQRCHWQPLSAHLWSYCTHPTHDVNDVMCEGWPQHRVLRPLLFLNSGVGSFMSHKNQISESAVKRDLRFFVLIR